MKHNRDYIGIELNPEYVELATNRILATKQDIDAKNAQCVIDGVF